MGLGRPQSKHGLTREISSDCLSTSTSYEASGDRLEWPCFEGRRGKYPARSARLDEPLLPVVLRFRSSIGSIGDFLTWGSGEGNVSTHKLRALQIGVLGPAVASSASVSPFRPAASSVQRTSTRGIASCPLLVFALRVSSRFFSSLQPS